MKFISAISVAILAIFLASCGAYQLSANESLLAEAGARDYAERSNAKFISCSGTDSDGDTYVTCTINESAVGTQATPAQDSSLLCSYKSRGCKKK